jgi:hypothetical protein
LLGKLFGKGEPVPEPEPIPSPVEGYLLKEPVSFYEAGHFGIWVGARVRKTGEQDWMHARVEASHPADPWSKEHWVFTKDGPGGALLQAFVEPDGTLSSFNGSEVGAMKSLCETPAQEERMRHVFAVGEPLIRKYEAILGMPAHRECIRALPLPNVTAIFAPLIQTTTLPGVRVKGRKVEYSTGSCGEQALITARIIWPGPPLGAPNPPEFEATYRRYLGTDDAKPDDAFSMGEVSMGMGAGEGVEVGPAKFHRNEDGSIESRYPADAAQACFEKAELLRQYCAGLLDIESAWKKRPHPLSEKERAGMRKEMDDFVKEAEGQPVAPFDTRLALLQKEVDLF